MRWMVIGTAALTLAQPAQAQLTASGTNPPVYGPRLPPPLPTSTSSRGPVPSSSDDIHDVRDRVSDGRRSGQIGRTESRRLKREADQTGTLADRYAQDGLSDSERSELEVRGLVLRDQVNAARSKARPSPPPR